MPEVVAPDWLDALKSADAALGEARVILARAEGARMFTQAQIEKRFHLGPADEVNMETGAITRAPSPDPAP